jgi:hypothetical protein
MHDHSLITVDEKIKGDRTQIFYNDRSRSRSIKNVKSRSPILLLDNMSCASLCSKRVVGKVKKS